MHSAPILTLVAMDLATTSGLHAHAGPVAARMIPVPARAHGDR